MQRLPYFEASPAYRLWGRRSGSVSRLLAGSLTLAGAVVLAHVVWRLHDGRQQATASNVAAEEIRARLASASADQKRSRTHGPTLTNEQREQLSAMVKQLNTPWHDLFLTLERHTPPEVALLALEPQGRQALVRVTAEARSLDRLLAYAASLANQDVLGELSYQKHDTNSKDPNQPIQLVFDLGLRSPERLQPVATSPRELK